MLLFLFGLGFFIPLCTKEPKVKLGTQYIYCNPKAKINLKKKYHLYLWDYNWSTNEDYQAYLKQVITDFQKLYPNIKVDFILLDLLNGPNQLEEALKTNNAPDIYCSAYMIPPFNYKRQIPVGSYLHKKEKEKYLPNTIKMLDYHGVLCYFPRWVAPKLWIGNKEFMEFIGLSVTKIQNEGWSWDDLLEAMARIPTGKYLLVGNLGSDGIFPQLIANAGVESGDNALCFNQDLNITTDFLEMLIRQKAIPYDIERNMLGRFMEGQAMILAGVRLSMYNLILQRLELNKTNWQPVLLPIPVRENRKVNILVENGVIAIYRNKRTNGDDHLTAAIKFGQFLSCYSKIFPWKQLGVYPAAKDIFNTWISESSLNTTLYKRIAEKSFIENFVPLSGYQEKVYPILNNFLNKKITGAEVKEQLKQ